MRRSTHDRILLGVCGGIAEALRIDPTIVRLLFIFVPFLNNFIVYIIIALLMDYSSNN